MIFSKKIDIIPKGSYCYDKKELCPYYSSIEKAGIVLPYCKLLKQGGIPDNITEEEFKRLKDFHHTTSNIDVYYLYPLDLIWDQVKECGENED